MPKQVDVDLAFLSPRVLATAAEVDALGYSYRKFVA
jgi:hypothetical protein